MGTEDLLVVFQNAKRTHGVAMVHLLVSWLKCSRILLHRADGFSNEILDKIKSRAFLRVEEHQFGAVAQQLGKNDLVVVSSAENFDVNTSAKIVGFGDFQNSWDGSFTKPIDASASIYFDRTLELFTGTFNESLIPTKYLFLDRDGVVVDYVPYIKDPSQVRLRYGILELIAEYRKRNHRIIMVTNQSGIARGYSTQEDFRQVQNRTLELLARQGQWIDACYFATYLAGSDVIHTLQYPSLRKPRTGMLAEESQFWNIDLENSVMIGDNASDVEWAQNAGLGRVFWLDNPELREKSPANMTNVTQVQSLDQILKLI